MSDLMRLIELYPARCSQKYLEHCFPGRDVAGELRDLMIAGQVTSLPSTLTDEPVLWPGMMPPVIPAREWPLAVL